MTFPYTTMVSKDNDGWTIAKGSNGQILAESNTSPETVIQTALDRKGTLMWMPTEYVMSNTFNGLVLKDKTHIISSIDTQITVPNGYTGGALIVDPTLNGDTYHQFDMSGGITIKESGSAQALWDGLLFRLNHATRGVSMCTFGPIWTWNANNSVCFDLVNSAGWVTSSVLDRITSYYTRNGLTVRNPNNVTNPGLSTLTIKDMWFQAADVTEYGFRGILGRNWLILNCAIWDMQNSMGATGNGVSAQFLPTCDDMLILGGIMMHHNVDNQAKPGKIRWLDSHSTSSDLQYIERSYTTNGSLTGSKTYTIAHGMGFTPDWVHVIPKSKDACTSPITWTVGSTNITITYTGTPPPPATAGNQNNVTFQWRASVK